MNADLLKAITDLVHDLAWPLVALVVIWRFAPELRGLLGRFRRAAGVEFDPPATQASTVAVATTNTALSADLPLSPSAAAVVEEIRAMPEFRAANDARRMELLLHATAWLRVIVNFERIEGQIWASQLTLLEHLNALDAGDSVANLKARFYDGAAARFPLMFASYPFESYLGFLRTNALIEVDAGIARITPAGRDYLPWRVQARKPPRMVG